jgi:8-oxo-dGTP pyrophosphatase MutT (NUDIX family)
MSAQPSASRPSDGARPAATLIVHRHPPAGETEAQVLMLERAGTLRFAAGACVFPGGGVDPADHALAATLPPLPSWDGRADMAARVAAIRETLEETGLAIGLQNKDGAPIDARQAAEARHMLTQTIALAPVLAHFGWRIAAEVLTPFARWLPNLPRPYDTRFYLADLGTGAVTLSADTRESAGLLWISPRAALAQADAGALSLVFPTRRNLERLALFPTFTQARDHALTTPLTTITPAIVERAGQSWLTIPPGLGYPVLEEPLESARRG